MPFKKILKNLVASVPGARGAILADWEGESVDLYSEGDDYDLKVTGAHKGILLTLVRDAHQAMDAPDPEEIVISTEHARVIVGAVGKEYSVVMTLSPDAVPAAALRSFRSAVSLLAKEIY